MNKNKNTESIKIISELLWEMNQTLNLQSKQIEVLTYQNKKHYRRIRDLEDQLSVLRLKLDEGE